MTSPARRQATQKIINFYQLTAKSSTIIYKPVRETAFIKCVQIHCKRKAYMVGGINYLYQASNVLG